MLKMQNIKNATNNKCFFFLKKMSKILILEIFLIYYIFAMFMQCDSIKVKDRDLKKIKS